MATRRTKRWWKERWVADHYAQIRSPKLLAGHIEYRGFTSLERFARAVSSERIKNGHDKGVSRQMISYLANGRLHTCEPDLAAAIESVLQVPDHTLFVVLPKSSQKRETRKADAA